jgi:hypothetical protein
MALIWNWWESAAQRRTRYSDIVLQNPGTSFPSTEPADLSHLGYLPIDPVDPPLAPTPQDEVIEGPPEEYTPDRMRQTWIVRPRPEPLPTEFDPVLHDAVQTFPLAWSD